MPPIAISRIARFHWLFRGHVGDLVNLRELEQMVDQLNRLPSNKAKMELKLGRNVGGSEVKVTNTPQKPWRAGLTRNNGGQRSTGEQQMALTFDWDNPLGLADQLSLRGNHDAMTDHQHTSRSTALYYNVPWGWWNFTYRSSQSEYRSQIPVNGYNFKQTGDTQTHAFLAERVVHRDAVSKTSLSSGISYLRTNNFIEDSKLTFSSNRISEVQFGWACSKVLACLMLRITAIRVQVSLSRATASTAPPRPTSDSRRQAAFG